MSVNGNWRIIFTFTGGQPQNVQMIDYHWETHMMLNPPHPGLAIRHDCLEPLGLTVTNAANALGVSRQALNNLVNGKAGITPEMAIRLDKAFGGGAETWLRMQTTYDLAQALKHADDIRVTPFKAA